MGYSKKVIETVKDAFEAKRKKAQFEAEQRRREMYAVQPMLEKIDKALASTGLKVYGAALQGKDGLEERLKALEKENRNLQDDRAKILAACGKPENYLDEQYACQACSDTGYVGLHMCDCMKKALIREAYHTSGLGASLDKQGFENFDLSFYTDVRDKNGVSDKDRMAFVLNQAQTYVKNFSEDADKPNENLLFIGKTGLGKTHISTAIAKGVIDKGYDVVYDTVQNILSEFEKQTFSHDVEAQNNVDRYLECSLLILDDLGTEFGNSFTQSVLYNLLNTRIVKGKAMIVSTNLDDSEQFKKRYDDRITSRLIGNFRTFKFQGEDIRIQKATKHSR